MAKFRDETTGQVIFIGNPDINPRLTAGKTRVADDTPIGFSSAERVSRRPGAVVNPLDTERTKLEGDVSSLLTPPSREGIREEQSKNIQAQLDAINAEFNRIIAGEEKAGAIREDVTRALNISGGLGGSDFASAAARKTEEENRKIIELREKERSAAIQTILTGAEQRVSTEFAERREAFLTAAEDRLSAISDFQSKQKEISKRNLQALAGQGFTSSEFKVDHPERYAQFKEELGFADDFVFDAFFDSLKNETDQEFKYFNLGNGKVVRFDKAGEEEEFDFDLGTAGGFDFKFAPDGTGLAIPKNIDPEVSLDEQIKIFGEEGQFAKPKSEDLTPSQKISGANTLAQSFERNAKTAIESRRQIRIIEASFRKAQREIGEGESINAASQGVLVAFQKLLDPTSVVRESEFARSAQGLSLIDRLEGKVTQIKQGGAGLTADALTEFVDLGLEFLKEDEKRLKSLAQRTANQAEDAGIPVENVLTSDIIALLEAEEETVEDEIETSPEDAAIGDIITIGGVKYEKVGEDQFEEVL